MSRRSSVLFLSLVLGACGDKPADPPAAQPPAAASPEIQKLVLRADPGTAKSVREAKAAGAADQVVVLGRIANIIKGRAVFTLMDKSVPYCGDGNQEDKCPTPWDYCCESQETRTVNSLLVEARGADGKPLHTPLPDLRLVDAVKVAGKLTVDEHGNHVLIATGLYRTERPALPDYVKWPQ